jgi:hypothetical protein
MRQDACYRRTEDRSADKLPRQMTGGRECFAAAVCFWGCVFGGRLERRILFAAVVEARWVMRSSPTMRVRAARSIKRRKILVAP